MRKAIATVSVSGVLADKLAAIAAAGFDGVELFDNDLVASPLSPREVRSRCADLGLRVELFQPVRDVEGVAPGAVRRRPAPAADQARGRRRARGTRRARVLERPAGRGRRPRPDRRAAARSGRAGGGVRRDPGLRGPGLGSPRQPGGPGLGGRVPRRPPSRHPRGRHLPPALARRRRGRPRRRPGRADRVPAGRRRAPAGHEPARVEPALPVLPRARAPSTSPVSSRAVLEAGYRGPLSLEVFSDVVREADPDGHRAGRPALAAVPGGPARASRRPAREQVASRPAAVQASAGFLELAAPYGDELGGLARARPRVRAARPAPDQAGRVVAQRRRARRAQRRRGRRRRATALGVVAPPVEAVAARARSLLWPAVGHAPGRTGRRRCRGSPARPGCTSSSATSPAAPTTGSTTSRRRGRRPAASWLGIDHVGVAVDPDRLNEEVGFFRTLFDLAPSAVEEFMEPHGRLRSRALRPAKGDLRWSSTAPRPGPATPTRHGVNQVAFACRRRGRHRRRRCARTAYR